MLPVVTLLLLGNLVAHVARDGPGHRQPRLELGQEFGDKGGMSLDALLGEDLPLRQTLRLLDVPRRVASEVDAAVGQLSSKFAVLTLNHCLAPLGHCGQF